MSLEQRITNRIAYLKRVEVEELEALDKVKPGTIERRAKWDFINEIHARRNELENALATYTEITPTP